MSSVASCIVCYNVAAIITDFEVYHWLKTMKHFSFHPEVQEALAAQKPVVALESTGHYAWPAVP